MLSIYFGGLFCTVLTYSIYNFFNKLLADAIFYQKLFLQVSIAYIFLESFILIPGIYLDVWDGHWILAYLTIAALLSIVCVPYALVAKEAEAKCKAKLGRCEMEFSNYLRNVRQASAEAVAAAEAKAAKLEEDLAEAHNLVASLTAEKEAMEAFMLEKQAAEDFVLEQDVQGNVPQEFVDENNAAHAEDILENMEEEQDAGDALTAFAKAHGLTAKEKDVLELAVESDITTKNIAEKLFISERVCQRYLTSIYEKTNSLSRINLIIKYYSQTRDL
ncbi:helix-turn-helix transcriptional regulator [Phascolarctobacterium sp.]